MPQEQHDHQTHDQGLFDEIALEGMDRRFDEARAVVGRADRDAGREGGGDRGEFRLHRLDDLQGVLTIAHHDDAADGLALPLPVRNAATGGGTEIHRAEILHQHRRAVLGGHRNVGEVLQ